MKTRNIIQIDLKKEGKTLYYTSLTTFFNNIEFNRVNVVDQTVKNHMSKNKTDVYENNFVRIEKNIPLYLDSKDRKVMPENIFRKDEVNK